MRRTGLNLAAGSTYYFYVKAKDGVGLWSNVAVAGVTVGCSSATIEDALRCADGELISCSLTDLLVLAGTSQLNYGGSYHMYVQDTTYGRISGRIYSLRVDFANGIPVICKPGNKVIIRGRMATVGGERVMVIDLNDTEHSYAVTDTTELPLQPEAIHDLHELGGENCTINDIKLPGITRPVGGSSNKGYLVRPDYYSQTTGQYCCVTYKDEVARFLYIDDGSIRYLGRDELGNSQQTDGNALYPGNLCAEGIRVDYSWMSDPLPDCEVGSFVRVTGISASMDLNNYTVRVIRLRQASDLEVGPHVNAPESNSVVSSDHPLIKWTDPVNSPAQPDHQYVQLAVTDGNYPPNAYDSSHLPVVVQTAADELNWPDSLQADNDYYAFVRVGNDPNVQDASVLANHWSPWSQLGQKFKVTLSRLIAPEDDSVIWDRTPLILWRYDPTQEALDTFEARICTYPNDEGNYIWSKGGIQGTDHIVYGDQPGETPLAPGSSCQ